MGSERRSVDRRSKAELGGSATTAASGRNGPATEKDSPLGYLLFSHLFVTSILLRSPALVLLVVLMVCCMQRFSLGRALPVLCEVVEDGHRSCMVLAKARHDGSALYQADHRLWEGMAMRVFVR